MKKITILLENQFDEQELIYPYHRLREDFDVYLVGSEKNRVYRSKSGFEIKSDLASKDVKADDFDGLFVPGGFSPDYMRRNKDTVDLAREMDQKKLPIAAICHGPWLLASACDLKGKKVTSFYSIKDDLIHAGAEWVDQETVVDGNILTARTPKDLPSLLKRFVEEINKE